MSSNSTQTLGGPDPAWKAPAPVEFSKEINTAKGNRAAWVTVLAYVGSVALAAAIDAVIALATSQASVTAILAPLVADHPAYAVAVPVIAAVIVREATKFQNKRKFQKEHGQA